MSENSSYLKKYVRPISLLLGITVLIFVGWYFSQITTYVIIAIILTMLCLPVKRLLQKIRYKKFKVGNTAAAFLSFAVTIVIFVLLFRLVFIPVYEQINIFAKSDPETFAFLDSNLTQVDNLLKKYNILSQGQSVEDVITNAVLEFIEKINISDTFGSVIHFVSNLFLGIFSILFISFFLLKDVPKFQHTVVSMMPSYLQKEMLHILQRSKELLSNYFVGLFVEIIVMGSLEFIILSLLGIPNALLISVIGGILVIIPYIGSVIALILGCIIAVMSSVLITKNIDMAAIILKVACTFMGCRLLDNFLLQPFIASKSVKAHPLEIFIVILISGSIAGIPGMMLGIPAYTIIRIIAQEFFGNINFVKTLTKSLGRGAND